MMCISLFSYGRPVVIRCMGVRLGMGWVGSWVHKFTWQWVGLGQLFGGLGWVGSMKIDTRTTRRPLSAISWILCVYCIGKISLAKQHRMPISTNLYQANKCFSLKYSVFAGSYVKLRYFVTMLSLVTLQGSVCAHVRWSGWFQCTLFSIRCLATRQIWLKNVNNF